MPENEIDHRSIQDFWDGPRHIPQLLESEQDVSSDALETDKPDKDDTRTTKQLGENSLRYGWD